jgi:hypothetical protein
MRTVFTALACAAALAAAPSAAFAGSKQIDLRTKQGVDAVKGQWRYADVKIVEVDTRTLEGKPAKTYNIQPKAFGAEFDDSKWEQCDPPSLRKARGGGQVCFSWYRIKVTIPEEARGKAVFFQTTVDDYGEVWVDGKLPRREGDSGGPIVAGFNKPNRLELKDATPGRVFQIAIFAINGPISAEPGNRIFLRETFLDFIDR